LAKIRFIRDYPEATEVSESDIQKAFEENLNALESGLEYVASFVKTGVGVIDTLAVDSEACPVVIEYKKPGGSDVDAVIQALDYSAWCRENVDWLTEYVAKKKHGFSGELNSEVRIVVVAKEFEDRVLRAARALEPETMLVSYQLFKDTAGEIGLPFRIELDTTDLPPEEKKPKLPKTKEDHFKGKENWLEVQVELERKVLSLDPNLKQKMSVTQDYIGFSNRLLFLAIHPKKEWLRLDIRGVKDLGKAPRFTPYANEWGYVHLRSGKEIDDELMTIIGTAYQRAS